MRGTFIKKAVGLLSCLAVVCAAASYSQSPQVLKVATADHPGFTRVTLTSSFPLSFSLERIAGALQVGIRADRPFRFQGERVESRYVKSLSWAKSADSFILLIEMKTADFRYVETTRTDPPRLIIDLFPAEEEKTDKRTTLQTSAPPKEDKKEEPAGLQRPESLPYPGKRLMTIVIDPGHGGVESGARGKMGVLEKDVALAVGLKLKAVIERHLAFRVEMTRDKDINVSLENRAALANTNKADLFISIHANSSFRKNAQGSEVFFLSLKATDEEARRLAYLENTSAELEKPMDESNQDELKMILWDMAQSAYLKQSSRLAEFIQNELNPLLGTENRGIKQAPFKVLTGVACPAVLVEVAFLSNADEEQKLKNEQFQDEAAQAIYLGLANYLKTHGS